MSSQELREPRRTSRVRKPTQAGIATNLPSLSLQGMSTWDRSPSFSPISDDERSTPSTKPRASKRARAQSTPQPAKRTKTKSTKVKSTKARGTKAKNSSSTSASSSSRNRKSSCTSTSTTSTTTNTTTISDSNKSVTTTRSSSKLNATTKLSFPISPEIIPPDTIHTRREIIYTKSGLKKRRIEYHNEAWFFDCAAIVIPTTLNWQLPPSSRSMNLPDASECLNEQYAKKEHEINTVEMLYDLGALGRLKPKVPGDEEWQAKLKKEMEKRLTPKKGFAYV